MSARSRAPTSVQTYQPLNGAHCYLSARLSKRVLEAIRPWLLRSTGHCPYCRATFPENLRGSQVCAGHPLKGAMRWNEIAKLAENAGLGCRWFGISFLSPLSRDRVKSQFPPLFLSLNWSAYGMAVSSLPFPPPRPLPLRRAPSRDCLRANRH